MDTWIDRVNELNAIRREEDHMAKQDYCERDCDCHNEEFPYYDAEEETWDYESCYEDSGGWE